MRRRGAVIFGVKKTNGMKLVFARFEKDGSGEVALIAEETEDMWFDVVLAGEVVA